MTYSCWYILLYYFPFTLSYIFPGNKQGLAKLGSPMFVSSTRDDEISKFIFNDSFPLQSRELMFRLNTDLKDKDIDLKNKDIDLKNKDIDLKDKDVEREKLLSNITTLTYSLERAQSTLASFSTSKTGKCNNPINREKIDGLSIFVLNLVDPFLSAS